MTKFNTVYSHPETEALIVPPEDAIVETGFHEDCDINCVVSRYLRKDPTLDIQEKKPVYGDFSKVMSYEDAKQAVIEAERNFMSLPPEVRRRFNDNPAELLKFVDDDRNLDEAIKLGLCDVPAGYKTPEQRALDEEVRQSVNKPTGETA